VIEKKNINILRLWFSMGMKADIGFCGILEVDVRLQVD
jgi:hypothetical protein